MQTKQITLINKLGLHARASMKLVDIATQFDCKTAISFKHKTVDAKDILDVMTLGAGCGSALVIETDGNDETAAMQAIIALIENRFGESE